jgi:hypothetical protein
LRTAANQRLGAFPVVKVLVTFMRRAIRIGLFIGTLIGVSAFGPVEAAQGPAAALEASPSR